MINGRNTIVFSVFLNVPLRKVSRSRFTSLRFRDFSHHPVLAVMPQNLLSIGQFSSRVCKLGLGLTARASARWACCWRGGAPRGQHNSMSRPDFPVTALL